MHEKPYSEKLLKEKILKYWNNPSKEDLKLNRKDLLGAAAKELKMPEELAERLIGDRQAGKQA
jgi:hypothetical protein